MYLDLDNWRARLSAVVGAPAAHFPVIRNGAAVPRPNTDSHPRFGKRWQLRECRLHQGAVSSTATIVVTLPAQPSDAPAHDAAGRRQPTGAVARKRELAPAAKQWRG